MRPELRFLVPSILAAGLIADVGLRFLPPERVAFRGWEAAILFPSADGPFTPNLVYETDHARGDLSNLGNLRSLRVYRPERFTTDTFGFRNTPASVGRPIRILVVGDSFTGGAGLSDSDTITQRLAELTQTGVYNCGDRLRWAAIEKLTARLDLRGGLIIWEILERGKIDAPVDFSTSSSLQDRVLKKVARSDAAFMRWKGALWFALSGYNPLRFAATQLVGSAEDGRWLPNPSAENVVVKGLRNGKDFIFTTAEVDNFGKKRPVEPAPYMQLQNAVRATGNQLLVLLVPDKYTVYYPLLDGAGAESAPGDLPLAILSRDLRARDIPVLDLTPVFRREAADALRDGRYIYWPDDTHWNPDGVKIAAREIVKENPVPADRPR
jgi:hypothetical protein